MPRKKGDKSASSNNVTWPVKVSVTEALEIEPKILYYAGGSRSLYIRTALLNYKPKKGDFKC